MTDDIRVTVEEDKVRLDGSILVDVYADMDRIGNDLVCRFRKKPDGEWIATTSWSLPADLAEAKKVTECYLAAFAKIDEIDNTVHRPLPKGTRIRYESATATVEEDCGLATLLVQSDETGDFETWQWDLDGVLCEVISYPEVK